MKLKPDGFLVCLRRSSRAALFLLPGMVLAAVAATPTNPGTISGRVSNQGTGIYLEGARLVLLPSGLTTLSGREGRYSFARVPAGTHTLSVSYTGLDSQTFTITVPPGGRHYQDVALSSGIYVLDSFVVPGEREGNALAITQQRNAPNVKNVISADAFGMIVDENVGNFLQRLPGITMEEQEGSMLFAKIRGISPSLNAVTVNGTRQPSGGTRGGLNRSFELDTVPADFIETIEVTKAPTPDMDADSIGGSINLKTKSALDRKGRMITYRVGGSYTFDGGNWGPLGNFMYSNRIGRNEQLGVMFTTSYDKVERARDVSLINVWERTTDLDRPVYFHLTSHGEDAFNHVRAGVGLRLDYKVNETVSVYGNVMFSHHESDMHRRRAVFNNVQLRVIDHFDANGVPRTASGQTASILPGWTGPNGSGTITETAGHRFRYDQTLRDRSVKTWNFEAGGKRQFAAGELEVVANYAIAKGREQRYIARPQVNGVGFRFDRSDERLGEVATWEQISGPEIRDPANFNFSNISLNQDSKQDEILGLLGNLRKSLNMEVPTYFKTGFRYREQKPFRLLDRRPYAYNGPNMEQFLANGSAAEMNPDLVFFDIPTIADELRTTPENFTENRVTRLRNQLRDDKQASESVVAAYVMGGVELNRLGILAGVRVEETRVKGFGNAAEVTPQEQALRDAWVGPVTEEENLRRIQAEFGNRRETSAKYRNVFPGVHFRYEPRHGLVTRASWSTGIGRPGFGSIIPGDSVSHENERVTANNTGLKPQYADNFDATVEYYYEPVGMVSASVFLKEISDFIFTADVGLIPDGPDNGFGGNYAGYELRTQQNGGFARVRGLEVALQHQFSHLPGFWGGLAVFANHTWLETVGDYGNIGSTVTQAELAGFVPRTASFGVSYNYGRWTLRTLTTYRGSSLQAIQADPTNQRFNKSRMPTDFSASYSFSPRLTVFTSVTNLFGSPLVGSYIFHPSRTRNKDGWQQHFKFGISGRL